MTGDWVEELRAKLAAVDEANRRLEEALEFDPLPMEILASSEAMSDLWEFMCKMVRQ